MTDQEKETIYARWSNCMDVWKILEKDGSYEVAKDYGNQVYGQNSLLLALGIYEEFIDRYFDERKAR